VAYYYINLILRPKLSVESCPWKYVRQNPHMNMNIDTEIDIDMDTAKRLAWTWI
jgi:hypothetical protein